MMRKEKVETQAPFPMVATKVPSLEAVKSKAKVYCALCTRTVNAGVTVEANPVYRKASLKVVPGQRCPRCSSSLDAAFVLGPNN